MQKDAEVPILIRKTVCETACTFGKAVTDAKKKAAVLTQAGGVKLKDIQSIDYSWGEINFEYKPMGDLMMDCCELPMTEKAYDLDIEPNDIDVSDTVTVVWEIA